MVLIDVQVALGVHGEVESRVARQAVEHVIEEADASCNVATPGAIEIEDHLHTRLACFAANVRGTRLLHSCLRRMVTTRVAGYVLAACAVLPLLAPEVWNGFRLALSDPVLGVLSPLEAPLSVRSTPGVWCIGLNLLWFTLAYRSRQFRAWEIALVVVGGVAALARLGNVWLDALLLVLPVGRQLAQFGARAAFCATAAACVAASVLTLFASRPPALPAQAVQAALDSAPHSVFADWRWSSELQQRLGDRSNVVAAYGLTAEPTEFWLDYLRVAQGHERWASILQQLGVELVVLNAADQPAAAELVRESADWRVVLDADGAVVARKSTSSSRCESPERSGSCATRFLARSE